MRMGLGLLGVLVIAGSASADVAPPIEPVFAVTAGRDGITVRMASHGCTKKSDLTVAVAKTVPRPLILVTRKHPDVCKAIDLSHADIIWSYAELGLQADLPFNIGNPLIADTSF
jgi:hypothetical protein